MGSTIYSRPGSCSQPREGITGAASPCLRDNFTERQGGRGEGGRSETETERERDPQIRHTGQYCGQATSCNQLPILPRRCCCLGRLRPAEVLSMLMHDRSPGCTMQGPVSWPQQQPWSDASFWASPLVVQTGRRTKTSTETVYHRKWHLKQAKDASRRQLPAVVTSRGRGRSVAGSSPAQSL